MTLFLWWFHYSALSPFTAEWWSRELTKENAWSETITGFWIYWCYFRGVWLANGVMWCLGHASIAELLWLSIAVLLHSCIYNSRHIKTLYITPFKKKQQQKNKHWRSSYGTFQKCIHFATELVWLIESVILRWQNKWICHHGKRPCLDLTSQKFHNFPSVQNCLSVFPLLYLLSVISNDCQSLNCKILISGKQISRTPVWVYVPVKWRDLEWSVNRSHCTWYIGAEHKNRHSNDWYLIFYPRVNPLSLQTDEASWLLH